MKVKFFAICILFQIKLSKWAKSVTSVNTCTSLMSPLSDGAFQLKLTELASSLLLCPQALYNQVINNAFILLLFLERNNMNCFFRRYKPTAVTLLHSNVFMLGESPASNVPSGSLVSMLPVVFLACTNIPLNLPSLESTFTAKIFFYIYNTFSRNWRYFVGRVAIRQLNGQTYFKLRTKRVA